MYFLRDAERPKRCSGGKKEYLGRRQAASHEILDLAFPGSNPGAPANLTVMMVFVKAWVCFSSVKQVLSCKEVCGKL